MSKVILYIATSLDGSIARANGNTDWLFQDQDYGYQKFFSTIGTIVMGRNTYEKVQSYGEYPYKGVKTYVLTHHPETLTLPYDGRSYSGDIAPLIETVRGDSEKNIWLVGGAHVSQDALNAGIIDEIIMYIHPIILTDGIKLFESMQKDTKLTLTRIKHFETGLVELIYTVNK